MPRRYSLFLIVSSLTLLADQLTKWWARASFAEHAPPEKFLGSFWSWELSYNTGSAFGLFRSLGGARIWLSIIGVIACIAIVVILRKGKDEQKWMTTALGLVAGGAVGNVIDRVWMGKVTDFVVWKAGSYTWPAFNVADAALVAGVAILFLDVGREQKKARLEKELEKKELAKKEKASAKKA